MYYHDEAVDPFYAVLREANWIMDAIPGLLEIRGILVFAVVGGSNSPYQIARVGDDEFVLLVDQRAFYYLLTICLRIQSLSPLSKILHSDEKPNEKNYYGKFLLDITKDIVFHTDDIAPLLTGKVHRSIFQAAFTYIIGHELAHVSHGHLEFLKSPAFSEFNSSEDDRNLTLRTLEMDADSSATSSVFDVFEHVMRTRPPDLDGGAHDYVKLLRTHYVAGAFIALLYLDTLASNYNPTRHPVGYARFLTTSGVFSRIFGTYCPDSIGIPEQVRAAIVETFVRLSGSLEGLCHPIASNVTLIERGKEPIALYNEIGIAAGLEHLEPLHGRWARIRPYLEAFHRGGRLAPASATPL
ncbi:hypothetical protein [Caulobacter sp. BP25]|uniref:hypothetical protein n=1 Tax=Caulobacter sp. BP25 TaxID=2048900 RepID=UPI00117F00A3|nr:hypothetical protein [Caulobacter sp. BP25]